MRNEAERAHSRPSPWWLRDCVWQRLAYVFACGPGVLFLLFLALSIHARGVSFVPAAVAMVALMLASTAACTALSVLRWRHGRKNPAVPGEGERPTRERKET